MPGDEWADIYIDVDETGHPLKCYMGKNNIPEDGRFDVCKAFLDDWHVQPITRDGKAGRGTVERHYIGYGYKHVEAESEARKAWFKAHPEERQECYAD